MFSENFGPVDLYTIFFCSSRTVHCTSDGLSLNSDRERRDSRFVVVRIVDGQHVLSMYLFFYIFDQWSVAKLTGSIFCLCIFSCTFSIDGRSRR